MTEAKGNTAVPQHGDHDRVAMLSLKADGTPDQHDPEMIGDKDFALAATKEQFTQQAVSAVDQAQRSSGLPDGAEVLTKQDPEIEALKSAHDDAATAAEAAAVSTVDALFVSAEDVATPVPSKPAGKTSAAK
jgi:hypothetical protein